MKLRYKVLAGITLIWLAYLVITYVGSREFLIKNFLELEHEHANNDIARVEQALDQIEYSLHTFTSDWAHWNDLYEYMEGKNPAFISKNVNVTALVNSSINFLSYWDAQDKLIISRQVDTDQKKFVAVSRDIEKFVYPGSSLFAGNENNKDVRGYIALPDGIMLVSAVPVTDANVSKKSMGTLITGRLVTDKTIEKIQNITKLNAELFLMNKIKEDANLLSVYQRAMTSQVDHFVQQLNENTLAAYSVIRDINQQPIAMIRVVSPRVIFQSGQKAIHYYLITFIVLGIFFAFLFVWLLRILVVSRLERLNDDLANISDANQFSRRVDTAGSDELSKVSTKINNMMDIIQVSHTELEQRVEERTIALRKTNEILQNEIMERKSIQNELIVHKEHLAQLAHYDGLTSLPNRVYLKEMLDELLKNSMNQNMKHAVLFIDLDRFKSINDALGHHMGDMVLKEVATRIKSVLRKNDITARLGGDEFIVILNDIGTMKLSNMLAEKILQSVSKPMPIDKHEFFLTASIGICIFPDDGVSLEDLQRNSDMAMYKSKHEGGDLYQYYSSEMNDAANEHIKLEASLRKAITNKEFILHYQPKYSAASGEIVGAEALMRWNHPEQGMISPAKFIPHAEESGLILQMGQWAIQEACRACKSWQEQGHKRITVAVNISPKQFRQQDIVKLISDALSETELEPQYLELEITENAVMDDVDAATDKLKEIQSMGIKIAIDDFGTGYTSIGHLKQFPVDILKIDQHFVKGIPDNKDDIAIISALTALAHSMGMVVVAEGIESLAQLEWLKANGCDIIQGYYLSKPLPESSLISELIRNNQDNASEFATDIL